MNLTLLLEENFQVPEWQARIILSASTNGINVNRIIVIDKEFTFSADLLTKFKSMIRVQLSSLFHRKVRKVDLLKTLSRLGPINDIELITINVNCELDSIDLNFLHSDSIVVNLTNVQISNTGLEVSAILSLNLERVKLEKGDELEKGENKTGFEMMRAQFLLNRNNMSSETQIFEGFSRVHSHSQSKTLYEAISMCLAVLRKSLEAISGSQISDSQTPDIWKITSSKNKLSDSLMKRAISGMSRILYGVFYEKKWRIAKLDIELDFGSENFLESHDLVIVDLPIKHFGVADPCGIFDEFVYCELLNSKTGKGVLGRWGNNEWELIDFPFGGHVSYPQIIEFDQKRYLFPEVSQWSCPLLFELDSRGYPIGAPLILKGLEGIRALDGTLFEQEGNWYLFAGKYPTSHERLNLYYSSSLFGEFIEHPKSPIVLDPRFSRMGGQLVRHGSQLIRFSQDCSEKYGRRLNLFDIQELGISGYHEVYIGSITFSDVFGPHAILKYRDSFYLDFYTEEFSFFAGYRRLKAKFL